MSCQGVAKGDLALERLAGSDMSICMRIQGTGRAISDHVAIVAPWMNNVSKREKNQAILVISGSKHSLTIDRQRVRVT